MYALLDAFNTFVRGATLVRYRHVSRGGGGGGVWQGGLSSLLNAPLLSHLIAIIHTTRVYL